MKNLIVGVDLAAKVIQVCVYADKKVQSNREMTPKQFSAYLSNLSPSLVVFEACASSNYWNQIATSLGHTSKLISSRLVKAVRQNQKTDKNDALAIIQASQLPEVTFVSGKTNSQQQAQSMLKLREQAVKQRTALKNQLIGLMREFNLPVSRNHQGFTQSIEMILEDADNELTADFRHMLKVSLDLYLVLCEAIDTYDHSLDQWIRSIQECQKLMKIEGIGKLNAVHLYIALASGELGQFKKGKDVSACIGLTPLQHSSGGKAKLGHIDKRKNSTLRSLLITGAMSVVQQVVKRDAKTKKEQWLQALVVRRGKKCAAVALANKTVRTAFAMLKSDTEYRASML